MYFTQINKGDIWMNKKKWNNQQRGKLIYNIGKIIAIVSSVAAILRIIPMNGTIQWSGLIVAILLILLGKRVENNKN